MRKSNTGQNTELHHSNMAYHFLYMKHFRLVKSDLLNIFSLNLPDIIFEGTHNCGLEINRDKTKAIASLNVRPLIFPRSIRYRPGDIIAPFTAQHVESHGSQCQKEKKSQSSGDVPQKLHYQMCLALGSSLWAERSQRETAS